MFSAANSSKLTSLDDDHGRDHERDVEENKLLDEIDINYDPEQRTITDRDWTTNSKKWDKAKKRWMTEVINGDIWNDGASIEELVRPADKVPNTASEFLGEGGDSKESVAGERVQPTVAATSGVLGSEFNISVDDDIKDMNKDNAIDEAAILDARAAPQPFLKKTLWIYLENWDKASAVKRDKIIWEFLKTYSWKHPMDMEHLFCCGGSLIFSRFTVGLQMAYMKRQRVPHYFMALKIFIRSLQGAEYTLQFASMGAILYIFEIVRVSETVEYDKKQALKFLLELMEGANGPGIKYFICSVPHYLESLVDFLTMCHNTSVVFQCRSVFEALCLGNTMSNISLVSKFVMAMLPCDFNPKIQALSFRVLQGIVRVNHEMAKLCLKPLQDNFKTDDSSLIVEMGELVLVIMTTPEADALVDILIASATGIRLKEEFESWDRLYRYRPSSGNKKKFKYKTKLQICSRDSWEKSMAKKNRKDNYHQQSGALFIINHMIRNRPDLTRRLIQHGIFGISLKAVGASPHWQVQTQGVKLILLLNELSKDCSLSYHLMIPQPIMDCIVKRSEDCLKFFTSPLCLYFRKLGRFSLKMWSEWVQKVVTPTKSLYKLQKKSSGKGAQVDSAISKKVEEIFLKLQSLWDNPLMEAANPPRKDSDEELSVKREGELVSPTLSQDNTFKLGRVQIAEDPKLESFRRYLDRHNPALNEFRDDILDARIDDQFLAISHINTANNDKDIGGIEMALLLDAENAMGKLMNAAEEESASGEEEEDSNDHTDTSATDTFHF